jgi:putative membrane protein
MTRRGSLVVALLVACTAGAALAHAPGESGSAAGWFADPFVEALIAPVIIAYLIGLRSLAAGEGDGLRKVAPPWRIASFAAAIAALVLALLSPLDELADASFAWHMAQHLTLMTVAAPLLAWSDAHLILLRAFPLGGRRRIGRALASVPGVREGAHSGTAAWLAFALFSATVWLWHLPGAYDAALGDDAVHTLEHLSYLITSVAFWRVVGTSGGRRLGIGTSILMVTLVGLQGAMLAALITLAPRPLYSAYAARPDALADQVTAGVLMWVPASLVYLASTVMALRRLFAAPKRLRRI